MDPMTLALIKKLGGGNYTLTEADKAEIAALSGDEVYVGADTPPEGTKVWINPDGAATFPMPTADDAGKVLTAVGANEAEWGEASGGGYKDMTLLAEVDLSQASGNIELTDLDNIEEIYIRFEGVVNGSTTASGYALIINNATTRTGVEFLPIGKSGSALFGWSSARYNGYTWMWVSSSGAISEDNYRGGVSVANHPYNQACVGVGRATALTLIPPSDAYKATGGTIKIYGR